MVKPAGMNQAANGPKEFVKAPPRVLSFALAQVVTAAETTIAVAAVPARATAVARRNS
jgi:hypothetical protein